MLLLERRMGSGPFGLFSPLGGLLDSRNGAVTGWTPPLDVIVTDDGYKVWMELPGVEKEKINIEFEEGVLTISGEKRREATQGERWHSRETGHGSFHRCVRFHDADGGKAAASFKNGVLEVVVPRYEAAKPKNIEVIAG